MRARWTDMLPLHYAAYFDCDKIIELLVKASGASGKLHYKSLVSQGLVV